MTGTPRPPPDEDRPVIWVDEATGLSEVVKALADEPWVAADMEADSFHSYDEKVCLLQLGTETTDYLVDPLAVDITPLGPVFADGEQRIIFHAAEYDILSLKRDYGFEFRALFDTQGACMALGSDQVGLARLVEEHFELKLPKTHQRSDWGKRPLSRGQQIYAARDVRYLHEITRRLEVQLDEMERREDAEDYFARLCAVEPSPRTINPDAFFKLKGFRDLDAKGRAIVRALYGAREVQAQAVDRPPFKVLSNQAILMLAEEKPRDLKRLGKLRGVPRNIHRWGDALLAAIEAGMEDPDPPPKRRPRSGEGRDLVYEGRVDRLKQWRKAAAKERNVAIRVVGTTKELEALARTPPRDLDELAGHLGAFRARVYGKGIMRALGDG